MPSSAQNHLEIQAFPGALSAYAPELLSMLNENRLCAPKHSFQVYLDGETLVIPGRVYYRAENLLTLAVNSQPSQAMALCLGTRHADGHVREACLRHLLTQSENWIAPYVIQLVGEYVIEVLQVIEQALPQLDQSIYARYLAQNPGHFATTARRVRSYWYCYYRDRYPVFENYPATRVLQAFCNMRDGIHWEQREGSCGGR
ncbi:hypothetical protein MJ904_18070 [Massilia sp. MB5]|uniref:hypothetical protein n=1 Tax=Massilia sp. MB5 TaxID=2919578 RepID=UPI001F0F75BE|nr:hypothetical protein [Massilia sp. MB5]UMR28994.1 hypothetical protein MJ904_18070 [Massilia sp. MB5]